MLELRKVISHVQTVGRNLSAIDLLASLRDPDVELLHCPLTLESLELPHLASDGNTYSHREIATWIERTGTEAVPAVSPMSRDPLLPLRRDAMLLPDLRVAALVSLAAGHGLILEDGLDEIGAADAGLGAAPRTSDVSAPLDADLDGSSEYSRTAGFYSSEGYSICVRDRDLLDDNTIEIALEYHNAHLLARIGRAREEAMRRADAPPSRGARWARNLGLRRS